MAWLSLFDIHTFILYRIVFVAHTEPDILQQPKDSRSNQGLHPLFTPSISVF